VGIERAALVFAFAALAAVVVGGCSEPAEVRTSASPTPTAVSPPISKPTWTGGVWPFTVPNAVLKCYAEDSMETFTSGGVEYGLNATAKRFGNFRDIDEIMPVGPPGYVEINDTRQPVKTYAVSLDGISSRASKLCS
jgi:hypothetical protein